MRAEGWLLDVAFAGGQAVLWIRDPDRGRVKLLDRYRPDLFVEPRGVKAQQLKCLLEEHEHITLVTTERRLRSIGGSRRSTVLRVHVDEVKNYSSVLAQVESSPLVGEVFDADLPHATKYLSDRGLIPMGKAAAETDDEGLIRTLRLVETGLEVKPPPLSVLRFETEVNEDGMTVTAFNDPDGSEHVFRRSVSDALRDFLDHFVDVDPDIVCCSRGELTEMLRLGELHGTPPFGTIDGDRLRLRDGRVHVEPPVLDQLGLAGLVERAQYARAPARMSADWGGGRAVESRQCYEARRRGILVPRAGFFQRVMTMGELLRLDHGGLILTPDVGLHGNVAALDFESMFPNLIVRRNISYETMGRGRCGEGFLLGFTRETLARRLYFKHLRKRFPKASREWIWCEQRQMVLKAALFCTYGYSGCFANRFGNVATFIEINRAARDCLVRSMNVARGAGFRTLYANNDSLFVHKPDATPRDYEELAVEIARRVGLPMAVENVFRFIVFLPQRADPGQGALNRYYGKTVEGGYECRGIELRRGDTPPYIARVQREAIEALFGCGSTDEVRTVGVERARRVVEDACDRIRRGAVPPDELAFSRALRRGLGGYKAHPPHVATAEALMLGGLKIGEKGIVQYIYVNADHRNRFRRVKPAEFAEEGLDAEKYVELVQEAAVNLLNVLM
jgi:DNA polymerase elongation subunit (family B)